VLNRAKQVHHSAHFWEDVKSPWQARQWLGQMRMRWWSKMRKFPISLAVAILLLFHWCAMSAHGYIYPPVKVRPAVLCRPIALTGPQAGWQAVWAAWPKRLWRAGKAICMNKRKQGFWCTCHYGSWCSACRDKLEALIRDNLVSRGAGCLWGQPHHRQCCSPGEQEHICLQHDGAHTRHVLCPCTKQNRS